MQKMLYPKESVPNSYSETPVLPASMMMYTNYASSSGPYSDTLAGNLQQPSRENESHLQQEIVSPIGLHDYSAWKNSSNEMMLMQPAGDASDVILSLGTHVTPGFQMPSIRYRDNQLGLSSFLGANQLIPDEGSGRGGPGNPECMNPGFPGSNMDTKMDISSYGMSSIGKNISDSMFLKAAQQLLDETVNVRIALKERNSKKELASPAKLDGGSKDGSSETTNEQTSSNNVLSVAEKQDLQNKLSKLLTMLDEVDHKYKQYYHQMQIVVSSFDMVAGSGAAKPYTTLALQTISRHFRSLRDSINEQICVTRKILGEQDASSNTKGISISRLRYVDRQLRQQRALQQLGMMQHHAWRPQRGLPENAVSILRAWLFEHFLHPYPKDSDKIMLARQTGLTRSQVSNWFINARVRLWKPMVEEMYKEEIGDPEMDSTSSAEVPKATKSDTKVSEERGAEDAHQTATSPALENPTTGMVFDSKFDHKSDAEIQNIAHAESQNAYPHEEVRAGRQAGIGSTSLWAEEGKSRDDQRAIVDENTIFSDAIGHLNGSYDRFMGAATAAYHMPELDRFGNGVSLTLGLQHREGGSLAIPVAAHHGFGSMRQDDVYNAEAPSSIGTQTTEFDCIDSDNRQLKFSSSQVLHDFAA